MDEGTLIMCGLDYVNIINAIKIVIQQFKDSKSSFNIVQDYDITNVSQKVVRIIQSYTDYVNKFVWKK
jgi:UDP-N-acetylglucosamine 2-epimerase (non-hydrolysing)